MKKKKALLVWAIICAVAGVSGLFTVWYVGLILLAVAGLLGFLYFKPKKESKSIEIQKSNSIVNTERISGLQKKSIRSAVVKYNGFQRIIAFDTETTGLHPETDRIIEIGAAVFENQHNPTESFSTLINPMMPIPAASSKVNNITDKMVASAPTEFEAITAFAEFLRKYMDDEHPLILVAHNAPFDIDFINAAFQRFGIEIEGNYVDTLAASRSIVKGLDNYKLGTLADYYKIENPAAHRALSDAETVGHLFRHLLSDVLNEKR